MLALVSFVAALLLCAQAASAQAPQYDLLLKGGRVIDPKNDIDDLRDVAIRGNRIAAVSLDIPAASARKVIDAAGLYVTPGLVDIHVHVFTQSAPGTVYDAENSVIPDHATFRTAVTTVVDAGTTGWRSFPDLRRRIIDRSKTRVLAMLNIVGTGMMNNEVEQNPVDMDQRWNCVTGSGARSRSDSPAAMKAARAAWRSPMSRSELATSAVHNPIGAPLTSARWTGGGWRWSPSVARWALAFAGRLWSSARRPPASRG
jgi:hypothetical protein